MNNIDYSKFSSSELLQLAKIVAIDSRGRLPKELYFGSFSLNSKLPFKATVLRELLLHRFSDYLDAAVELYESNRIAPAYTITRALVETTALMYLLSVKTTEFVETKNVILFDDFLMKGMFGSKDKKTPVESFNVLTLIDHLDKMFSGMREMYGGLCEFTHPNYSGLTGSYSSIDEVKHIALLGKNYSELPIEYGLIPLIVCVDLFTDYYNSLAKKLEAINDFFGKD